MNLSRCLTAKAECISKKAEVKDLPFYYSAVYISLQHPSTLRGEFGKCLVWASKMDRTLIAVRKMLVALDAPAYDIGILSDRGVLPGLSNLPDHLVMSRLPLLRAHNSRGAHLY